MIHPNLFFTKQDVENYRAKMAVNEAAKAKYDAAVADVEKILEEPFITIEDCDKHNFGMLRDQTNRFLDTLGFKYLFEGDERCLQKLKEAVRWFCSWPRWYSLDYKNRKPLPWHSDLFSTAAAMSLGKIYDIIHDGLTPDEQKELAEALYKTGIEPAFRDWLYHDTRLHCVDSMGHNWWAVCICEPGMAFVAIADHLDPALVARVRNEIDDALVSFLAFNGNPMFNKIRTYDEKGLFYESMSYGDYATGTLFNYLSCEERAFGRNERVRAAIPAGIADAIIAYGYPTEKDGKNSYIVLNFGDCDHNNRFTGAGAGALRLGLDNSALRAALACDDFSLWNEISGVCAADLKGDWATAPTRMYFPHGFAMLRDSWKPNATLLGIKSGYAWNHSHNDAGSFIIFHKGNPFFIDSTCCDYSNEIYRDYYCQDVGHNVLRVGHEGPLHDNVHFATKVPGRIDEHVEGDGFVYVRADCAGPRLHLCTRMYRNFVWIDNRILLLLDEVFCNEPNDVQFLLHYNGTCEANGNVLDFRYEGATGRLTTLAPTLMAHNYAHGHPHHQPDVDMVYLELSTVDKSLRHLLLHSLELEPQDHNTKIEVLGTDADMVRGIRVADEDKTTTVWFNRNADGRYMHDNSIITIDGYETDAYMLIQTEGPARTSQMLAVGCSFLRKDGKVLHGSFEKQTFTINL